MLELSYILLSIVMAIIILVGNHLAGKHHFTTDSEWKSNSRKVIIFLLGLLAYIVILSTTQVLTNYGLPPRFLFFIFIPFVLFCIFFYRKKKNNAFIQSIPLHWTTLYQSFRIPVEVLLSYTFLQGIIPEEASFHGYNFDIAIGVSAIGIGYLIYKTGSKYKSLLRFWNVLGIAMVLFVAFIVATSIYRPQIWGFSSPAVSKEFLQLPYLLIPVFLAPSAIFMHVVSLIQLNKDS